MKTNLLSTPQPTAGQQNSGFSEVATGADTAPKDANEETSLRPARVAAKAYDIWLQKGCPDGCHMDNWKQAEQELTSSPVLA